MRRPRVSCITVRFPTWRHAYQVHERKIESYFLARNCKWLQYCHLPVVQKEQARESNTANRIGGYLFYPSKVGIHGFGLGIKEALPFSYQC